VSLTVSSDTDGTEIARFYGHVVKGPASVDCWLWVGAIADDGYGRFWIGRDSYGRVVRPHRYALALALDGPLEDDVVAEHAVCDNPICVRADGTRHDHVRAFDAAGQPAADGCAGEGRWQLVGVAVAGHRPGQRRRLVPGAAGRGDRRVGRRPDRGRARGATSRAGAAVVRAWRRLPVAAVAEQRLVEELVDRAHRRGHRLPAGSERVEVRFDAGQRSLGVGVNQWWSDGVCLVVLGTPLAAVDRAFVVAHELTTRRHRATPPPRAQPRHRRKTFPPRHGSSPSFRIGRAERRRIPGRTFAGVLVPLP
jgi:hypothetical protein